MASPNGPPSVSDAERKRYDAHVAAQVIARLRWGLIAALLLVAAIAMRAPFSFSDVELARMLPALGAMLTAILLTEGLSFVPWLARHPNVLVFPLGLVIAVAAAFIATFTGGFASPFFYVLFVVWIFGSAILPLPARAFALDSVAELLAAVFVVLQWGPPGAKAITGILTVGALAFCVLGAIFRDRVAARAFAVSLRLDEVNQRLAESQERLALSNAELELRVDAQVGEIRRRATEIDVLNAQLMMKVQERSRELALALSRVPSGESVLLEEGSVFEDRVEIVRLLGAGGMGEVYEGRDRVTGRPCALKILRGLGDTAAIKRFVAEAAVAASITHAGVVKPLHVDVSADGRVYQLMEYIDGKPLDEHLARGVFAAGPAARLGAALADALAAAHAAGVIHRDVKPNNVVLSAAPPGVRLLDFGVSKAFSEDPAITGMNQIVGTPLYMSPEQIRAPSTVTGATDVYALGLVLHRMLAGRHPFRAADMTTLMLAHFVEIPPALSSFVPGVPARLSDLVVRALQKSPQDRPTAEEAARTLTEIADALGAPAAHEIEGPTLPAPEQSEVQERQISTGAGAVTKVTTRNKESG